MAPNAGPAADPAPKTALAKARSLAGNHSRMIRLDAGQLVASPAPITIRVAAIVAKLEDAPVAIVAADHRAMPPALTALPPKRSTSRPTGIRHRMYIHRND